MEEKFIEESFGKFVEFVEVFQKEESVIEIEKDVVQFVELMEMG